ncbi:MAG: hypothetical protein AVDCRST_MAG77-4887, partial [uncultured Chloroflexi bacterium]
AGHDDAVAAHGRTGRARAA